MGQLKISFYHLSNESHESILCRKNMIAPQRQCDRCIRRTDETVGREKVSMMKLETEISQ